MLPATRNPFRLGVIVLYDVAVLPVTITMEFGLSERRPGPAPGDIDQWL